MPQLRSSEKALRQSLKRRDRNRARKRAAKLASRAALDAAKAQAPEAGDKITLAQKAFDKAARSGAIHQKTADRRKSRLIKRLNALKPRESA